MALMVGVAALLLEATMDTSLPMTSTAFISQCKGPFSSKTKPSGLIPTHTSWFYTPFASIIMSLPIYTFSLFTHPENTLMGGVPRNFATKRFAGES